jgi:hypothetical protein
MGDVLFFLMLTTAMKKKRRVCFVCCGLFCGSFFVAFADEASFFLFRSDTLLFLSCVCCCIWHLLLLHWQLGEFSRIALGPFLQRLRNPDLFFLQQ